LFLVEAESQEFAATVVVVLFYEYLLFYYLRFYFIFSPSLPSSIPALLQSAYSLVISCIQDGFRRDRMLQFLFGKKHKF
jgi:hypothetical protein